MKKVLKGTYDNKDKCVFLTARIVIRIKCALRHRTMFSLCNTLVVSLCFLLITRAYNKKRIIYLYSCE